MGKDLQKLKDMWHKFVTYGEIDPTIDTCISESWIRSQKYGVDCIHGGIGKMLSQDELNKILRDNNDLVLIALPIMQQIMKLVEGVSWVSLTNQDGYIIEILVNEDALEKKQAINNNRGIRWCEEDVGTNAISLCMIHDKPMLTAGAEHYCLGHHSGMCAATPVHDENNKIIGCLNITCNNKYMDNNILSLSATGAAAIEKQAMLFRAYEIINKTFNSISEGMIVTDTDFTIIKVNANACKILNTSERDLLNENLTHLLKDMDLPCILLQDKPLYNEDCCFYINNTKRYCKGNINFLNFHSKKDGIVIIFNKEKNANQLANDIIGNRARYTFDKIITQNQAMLDLISFSKKISKSNCNVLMLGESGTGKELFAQSIHNESSRANGPFVAVNCAAIPRDLVESELFGYVRGSFTGASNEGYTGKFELANGGTLFLDEIGDMPIEIQSKILRVLDNRQITRIGSKHEKSLDVRVIAATNKDLLSEVKKKLFRLDLYYRLNVVSLNIPSLNERNGDIRLLADYFLQQMNNEEQKTIHAIDEEVLAAFEEFEWPGNIRQLQNLISSMFYYCEDETITMDCLPENEFKSKRYEVAAKLKNPIHNAEMNLILNAITDYSGNITKAAKTLGLSKSTLYRWLKKYGIDTQELSTSRSSE